MVLNLYTKTQNLNIRNLINMTTPITANRIIFRRSMSNVVNKLKLKNNKNWVRATVKIDAKTNIRTVLEVEITFLCPNVKRKLPKKLKIDAENVAMKLDRRGSKFKNTKKLNKPKSIRKLVPPIKVKKRASLEVF